MEHVLRVFTVSNVCVSLGICALFMIMCWIVDHKMCLRKRHKHDLQQEARIILAHLQATGQNADPLDCDEWNW